MKVYSVTLRFLFYFANDVVSMVIYNISNSQELSFLKVLSHHSDASKEETEVIVEINDFIKVDCELLYSFFLVLIKFALVFKCWLYSCWERKISLIYKWNLDSIILILFDMLAGYGWFVAFTITSWTKGIRRDERSPVWANINVILSFHTYQAFKNVWS